MSELIKASPNRENRRWQLLATVSTLALAASAIGSEIAQASATSDQPAVWIELGGQLERIDGNPDPFLPPFTRLSPTPEPYSPVSPADAQKPTGYSYGAEGKISFKPGSDGWIFGIAARYGRSNNTKHTHQQSFARTLNPKYGPANPNAAHYLSYPQFADFRVRNSESHAILDFEVGKDLGIGLFGHRGTSTISGGLRAAEFATKSEANIIARPKIDFNAYTFGALRLKLPLFNDYGATAETHHSFRGIGPEISWKSTSSLTSESEDGEIAVDWGVNLGILFGRQKMAGSGHVSGNKKDFADQVKYRTVPPYYGVVPLYNDPVNLNRTHSVVVPNLGGFAGISFRYAEAKVSLGYRGDFFFNAMDNGIDERKRETVGFYGPFATISIGLGKQ